MYLGKNKMHTFGQDLIMPTIFASLLYGLIFDFWVIELWHWRAYSLLNAKKSNLILSKTKTNTILKTHTLL